MKKMKCIIKTVSVLLLTSMLFAQDAPELQVSIRGENLVYYNGVSPVIEASITNTGTQSVSFRLYAPEYTTFQPVVYDLTGREAETIVQWRLQGKNVTQVVDGLPWRTVHLAPNERFSRTLYLNDYYRFIDGKKYRVKLFFMPDASQNSVMPGQNTIVFSLKTRDNDAPVVQAETAAGEITPSEIVSLFLSAEKKGDWDNYLKYISLDKYIYSYSDYAREFNSADAVTKKQVLYDFREYLSQRRSDYIVDYEIVQQTNLENGSSEVKVRVARASGGKPFVYLYTYRLEHGGAPFWVITDVSATRTRER